MSARKRTGSEAAVCTSATIVVDEERLIISQAAAICWTTVPKLEASVAVQMAANIGERKGASAPGRCDPAAPGDGGVAIDSNMSVGRGVLGEASRASED
jgi:hypothetical protein